MKIGVITYDIPHLKTQDLIFKLISKKYKIKIIITKFKKFKKSNDFKMNLFHIMKRISFHTILQKQIGLPSYNLHPL